MSRSGQCSQRAIQPDLEHFVPSVIALRFKVSRDVGRATAQGKLRQPLRVSSHQISCLIYWEGTISFVFLFWLTCLLSDVQSFHLRYTYQLLYLEMPVVGEYT